MTKLSLSLLLLILISCTKTDFTRDECELLSMEAYKGLPKSSYKLKNYCSTFKLTFTAEKCQKAFNDFALHGDVEILKKSHTPKIMNCFTARDIRSLKKEQ